MIMIMIMCGIARQPKPSQAKPSRRFEDRRPRSTQHSDSSSRFRVDSLNRCVLCDACFCNPGHHYNSDYNTIWYTVTRWPNLGTIDSDFHRPPR